MAEDISFEKELEKLNKVIKSVSAKFPERHRADLVQEGILGLYSAIGSYDGSRGVPFEAYAVTCIKRKMYTYCTRFIKNDIGFIEELDFVEDETRFEEDVVDRTLAEDMFAELRLVLSDLENSVLELYLKDLSYSEIAKRMSVSEKSVDNAMSRIKTKLKKIFEAQL